jgi:hypothetical protein
MLISFSKRDINDLDPGTPRQVAKRWVRWRSLHEPSAGAKKNVHGQTQDFRRAATEEYLLLLDRMKSGKLGAQDFKL